MHAARRTAWRVLLAIGLAPLTAGCRADRELSGPTDDPRDLRERTQWEINSDDARQSWKDVQEQRAANAAAFDARNSGAKR